MLSTRRSHDFPNRCPQLPSRQANRSDTQRSFILSLPSEMADGTSRLIVASLQDHDLIRQVEDWTRPWDAHYSTRGSQGTIPAAKLTRQKLECATACAPEAISKQSLHVIRGTRHQAHGVVAVELQALRIRCQDAWSARQGARMAVSRRRPAERISEEFYAKSPTGACR
jgi:hypothetical protein